MTVLLYPEKSDLFNLHFSALVLRIVFIDRFFLTKAFLSESGCKDKNFISYLPIFFEVFFRFSFSGVLCEALLDKDYLQAHFPYRM